MSTNEQKTAINIVMGAMTFGTPGSDGVRMNGARVHKVEDVEAILDTFRAHGHAEVDTARIYNNGTSEEFLGKIDLASKGLKLATKLFPMRTVTDPIIHNEEGLRKYLQQSLDALNVKTLDMWYLHGPDRTVPYEETLKVVNDLYKEGYFKRFGISNYAAWEVAEIVGICKANDYIQPSVYQGVYNAIHRGAEPELFPCLRKFGISFYAFSPLAGGFFTGRYTSLEDTPEEGSRFDPKKIQGQHHRNRYWNEPYFKAISSVKEVAEKHNLTIPEIALRWISHHSLLKREYGDSILIGGSSLKHIEQNLVDLEKGPLPEDVVAALDSAWFDVKPFSPVYHH